MTPPQSAELHRRLTHALTRRHFFRRCGVGLGTIALHQMLQEEGRAAVQIDAATGTRMGGADWRQEAVALAY